MDQIIATKLFRPKPAKDFVRRDALFDKLEKGADCNLTLVSAPAGYGKSVTVSSWLEKCERPSTWVALSGTDNDFKTFVTYFIAAIESLESGLCSNTSAIIKCSPSLSEEAVTKQLIVDIQSLNEKVVAVLDDVGFLRKPSIIALFEQILIHCYQNLQLVLITRRDPPLSLHKLRLDGKLAEIRHSDLKFQSEDIIRFLHKSADITVTHKEANLLLDIFEGWPAGMRLISINVKGGESVREIIGGLRGGSREIKEYLIKEVLAKQLPSVRDTLLRTSILRKFSKELCEHLCDERISGEEFVDHLVLSNIFVIKVSFQGEWYRYHHLFQDLLKFVFEQKCTIGEIEKTHRKAAAWHADKNNLEEAIYHYVEIGDDNNVLKVLEDHRHELMNQEKWALLDYLIGLLPEKLANASPAILATKAFLAENRFFIGRALEYTEKLERLCEKQKRQISKELLAEKDTLLTLKYYLQNNTAKSVECGLRAIDTLPETCSSVIGFAHGLTAFSMQMEGNISKSLALLSSAVKGEVTQKPTLRGRLLLTLCFMYWFEGDLESLRHVATIYDDFAESSGLPEGLAFSKYFLSIGAYQQNRLHDAESYLLKSAEITRNVNITAEAQNAFTLSIIQYELGKVDQANDLAEQVVRRAYDLGNNELLIVAKGFRVDLGIRQGRKRVAEKWLKQAGNLPLLPVYRMYSPYLTEIRALMAQESEIALKLAREKLDERIIFFRHTHQTPMLIELYILLAKLYEQKGRNSDAEKSLLEAIILASAGRFVSVFRSMPQPLLPILHRLKNRDINTEYYNQLVRSLNGNSQNNIVPEPQGLTHSDKGEWQPLSNRELDILIRLSKRLSNKEIATELFISTTTVKRHTVNIYNKLEVHSRRDAVHKAQEIGLLI